MTSPYRAAGRADRSAGAPAELARNGESATGAIVAVSLVIVVAGAIVGGAMERFAPVMAGALVVTVVVGILLGRIADSGIVFTVVDGTLAVRRGRRGGKVLLRLRLEDLADVKIDTVEMSAPPVTFSMTPGFGQRSRGPSTHDESRIVLYPRGGEPFPLTERYASVTETTDWLGEIRRFLRAQGWLPLDERGAEPS